MEDAEGLNEYMNIVHHCFDVYLSMGILRLKGGCDFSKVIGQEEQIAIPSDGDGETKKADDEVSEDGKTSGLYDFALFFIFVIFVQLLIFSHLLNFNCFKIYRFYL
jgi:hypothetical protein